MTEISTVPFKLQLKKTIFWCSCLTLCYSVSSTRKREKRGLNTQQTQHRRNAVTTSLQRRDVVATFYVLLGYLWMGEMRKSRHEEGIKRLTAQKQTK